MELLPVFLKIRDQVGLVIGGGEVAARKATLLLRAGARVRVVAPELCAAFAPLLAQPQVTHVPERYATQHLAGCVLCIAATDDAQVNHTVAMEARLRGIPVNVADQPALCTFYLPSIIDRGPVIVAVSSGGHSPVLARLLRARLETLIPAAYGQLATLSAEFRAAVQRALPTSVARRRFWEAALQGEVAEHVFAGREDRARTALQRQLDEATQRNAPASRGEIYLVGAGPGDPDLLTFRALRLMQQADVVLYDRLVTPPILDLVRREAERIYVGKRRAHHALRQEEINALLVELAQAGKRVLRLKGGDPFIFGRGGEEIDTLSAAGIPFQIVPGITAANGCAAYAGIPLTHRDYAQSVLFVTAHLKDGSMDLNWPALVQPRQTVVVYMGLTGLDLLCRELIAHGRATTTPVALIQQGTTPQQKVLIGTLETLAGMVATSEVHAPTLLIVGEVVQLHERLAWFHHAADPAACRT